MTDEGRCRGCAGGFGLADNAHTRDERCQFQPSPSRQHDRRRQSAVTRVIGERRSRAILELLDSTHKYAKAEKVKVDPDAEV